MSVRVTAGIVALLLSAGCVTVPEYRALEREVASLKRAQAAGEGGGVSESRARLADLGYEVEELRHEVARLRGELEEVHHMVEQVRAEAAASGGPAPAPPEAPPEDAPPGSAVGSPEEPAEALSAEVAAYEEAFRLYRAQDYHAAIDRFRAFLQTHASSEYADNALFWLGDCLFRLGRYEESVLAFDDVVKKFPEGNKVPDALYRQGVALLEIGKAKGEESTYRPAARQIFEQLVREHPDSERIPEARRQLEKLGT
jgi:tol-pal system protein YbgF